MNMDAKTELTEEQKAKLDAQLREMAAYIAKGIFDTLRRTGYQHCTLKSGKQAPLDESERLVLYCIQNKPSDAQHRKEYRAQRRNMLAQILKEVKEVRMLLEHRIA